jgi:glycosyltransferase involved in cell wall biosynthesis
MGGGQRTALRLACAVPGSVVVARASSPLGIAAVERGVRVIDAAFPDPGVPALSALPRLRRVLAAPAGIVVSTAARCGLYAAVARPRLPVVHLMLEQDSARSRVLVPFYRRRGRVVALGEGARAAYERAIGRPDESARNFLSDDELSALAGAARGRQSPPRIGVIARMIAEKGLVELVEEIRAVPDAWSTLSIVASSEDAAYERRVRSSTDDRVVVTEAPDLRAFLASIDALVVPSTGHEGQPTVIVEALAAGVPVIVRRPIWSSDFEGLPVVPYATSAELAAALRALPAAADPAVVRDRFGVEQALAAILRAAGRV